MLNALVLIAGSCVAAAQTIPDNRPLLMRQATVTGSLHDIGYAVGSAFQSEIHLKLQRYEPLRQYVKTQDGKKAIESLRSAVEASSVYGRYLDEVRGLAQGANVSLDDAFLMQCGDELENLMRIHVPHCSDVANPEIGGGGLMAHNEDAGVSSFDWRTGAPLTYLVNARETTPANEMRVDGNDSATGFTALCYPGQLPTGAFGFNTRGLFLSLNGLFPEFVNVTGIPRHFVHRHLLTAPTVDDLIRRLKDVDVACGFSINVASVSEPGRIVNMEVATGRAWSVMELRRGEKAVVTTNEGGARAATGQKKPIPTFTLTAGPQPWPFPYPDGSGASPAESNFNFHFNEYVRMHTKQFPDPSSFGRASAAHSLPVPSDAEAMTRILGDKSNSTFPLWRNGAPPDGIATVCTALFWVSKPGSGTQTMAGAGARMPAQEGAGVGELKIFVRDPRDEKTPLVAFDVRDEEASALKARTMNT